MAVLSSHRSGWLSDARPPGISDGREAQDDGQELLASLHEVGVELVRRAFRRLALRTRRRSHHLADLPRPFRLKALRGHGPIETDRFDDERST